MKVYQKVIVDQGEVSDIKLDFVPDLILLFVSPIYKNPNETIALINAMYPTAIVTGCSTSGEIHDVKVMDKSIAFNAIKFEKTAVKMASIKIKDHNDSYTAGISLYDLLNQNDLKHIILFCDGLLISGDQLVAGMTDAMPNTIGITGGLAGDGSDFNHTFIINQDTINSGEVVAIGFYGEFVNFSFGSKGGWDSFGIERMATKTKGNILYELDGKPALEIYKSFLGDKASGLPASGLLFPLSMRKMKDTRPVVRTILGINEKENSLTFAGEIPEGSYVRLMKANIDRLINGAEDSAKIIKEDQSKEAEFALLVSCVGRRLVLGQLIEEELEAVRGILGDKPSLSGFYSYGELAPFEKDKPCELHNQTMTITTISETV